MSLSLTDRLNHKLRCVLEIVPVASQARLGTGRLPGGCPKERIGFNTKRSAILRFDSKLAYRWCRGYKRGGAGVAAEELRHSQGKEVHGAQSTSKTRSEGSY